MTPAVPIALTYDADAGIALGARRCPAWMEHFIGIFENLEKKVVKSMQKHENKLKIL